MTVPVESEMVKELAFNEPDVLKLIPPVPAVRLAVPAARAPLAVMPPAALEAFRVKDEPELAPSEMFVA